MSRKIIVLLVTILLLVTCSYSASADTFEQGKLGAITVTLNEKNNPLVGVELSVYHVATVTMDVEGDLVYDYTKDFEAIKTSIADSSLAVVLDVYLSQHNVPSVKIKTDSTGTAACSDLPLGLYFIKQTSVAGGVASCTPFLVTVPTEMGGEYVYAVNASPKTEVESLTTITIKKVWNTNASTPATDYVTVQLLKNGVVVETAILNAKNNWQVNYPNMPQNDAYSIKEVNVPKGFTATYQQEENVFTVTNSATLIQTGQVIWPIPVLAVSGMLFLVVGFAFLQKKRKTNE
ncbi:MAG: Cna B-type domain-containing protein [Clostridia bacterium]|nr:Cna B-type domain-containing protein [Clostridia bacterium]